MDPSPSCAWNTQGHQQANPLVDHSASVARTNVVNWPTESKPRSAEEDRHFIVRFPLLESVTINVTAFSIQLRWLLFFFFSCFICHISLDQSQGSLYVAHSAHHEHDSRLSKSSGNLNWPASFAYHSGAVSKVIQSVLCSLCLPILMVTSLCSANHSLLLESGTTSSQVGNLGSFSQIPLSFVMFIIVSVQVPVSFPLEIWEAREFMPGMSHVQPPTPIFISVRTF
ncbi:hypothetical protein V8F33_001128 [Rhypophila sp. PSN 637]